MFDRASALAFHRIEEIDTLRQVVEQARECKTCLREILDFELSYLGKDLNVISRKMIIALKVLSSPPHLFLLFC